MSASGTLVEELDLADAASLSAMAMLLAKGLYGDDTKDRDLWSAHVIENQGELKTWRTNSTAATPIGRRPYAGLP